MVDVRVIESIIVQYPVLVNVIDEKFMPLDVIVWPAEEPLKLTLLLFTTKVAPLFFHVLATVIGKLLPVLRLPPERVKLLVTVKASSCVQEPFTPPLIHKL